ncbi:MAG: CsgG/HfaB family protein [Treponema sp.]|jgi:hypothetical protein|nr:CsgG/HfaB family protein [Treponema sp.]
MIKTVCLVLSTVLFSVGVVTGVFADIEIIVQRADSKINGGFRERIFVDGSQKLTLANGASGTIRVPDGDHTIYAELSTLKTTPLSFSARSGTVKFLVTPHSLQNFVIERTDGGGQSARPAVTAPDVSDDVDDAMLTDMSVEGSLLRAGNTIMEKLAPRSRLAIVYVTARDEEVSEFIAGELEFIMVSRGFILIDRSELDRIRREQAFQSSGEVDDNQAVSIGKIAGADVIITGAVTGTGNLRRLRLRALSTETGQVLTVASERY